jgi:hypothetical protein
MEEANFAGLAASLPPDRVARVPFLPDDVHDLAGLEVIRSHLMGE